MKVHSFDIDVAAMVGVAAATIHYNLTWWAEKNAANGRHQHEGRSWTYNSVAAFAELFPYLSASQIKTAIKKLEDAGLVLKDNFNKENRDRTIWYSPVSIEEIPISEKSPMQKPEIANPLAKNRQPLPDDKPVVKPSACVTGEADLFAADADDQKQRRNPEAQKLPFSWVPSEADKSYALKQGLTDQEISEIAESFRVYFTEGKKKNDKRTFKGWQQSWQGWVRREKSTYVRNRRLDARGNGLPNRGPASVTDALRELGEQAEDHQ